MRGKQTALAAMALVLALGGAGGSLISLTGSDQTPGNGRTEAACVQALDTTNAVELQESGSEVVTSVSISGDLSACVGHTILVEVDLGAPETHTEHVYAVRQLATGASPLEFTFGPEGDFYDTSPIMSGGTLIPQGQRVDPLDPKVFGLMAITIAKTWG